MGATRAERSVLRTPCSITEPVLGDQDMNSKLVYVTLAVIGLIAGAAFLHHFLGVLRAAHGM